MNFYETLEVSPNASEAVLKAAYKSLMQRYHPDRNPGDASAAEHSLSVVQAYEVLSDPVKRAAYDIELKKQLSDLGQIRNPSRISPVYTGRPDVEEGAHWYIWLLFGSVLLAVWYIFPPFEKVKASGSELKEIGSVLGSYQPQLQPDRIPESVAGDPARTIPVYIKELKVKLVETRAESAETPLVAEPHVQSIQTLGAVAGASESLMGTRAESAEIPPVAEPYVLSIQTLGIVVGASDADEFISFLENNKETVIRDLASKLANAQYEKLVKHNGDEYLKRVILDSIGETTGTNRHEELPSAGFGPTEYYGAVDVLLPDSFTVK